MTIDVVSLSRPVRAVVRTRVDPIGRNGTGHGNVPTLAVTVVAMTKAVVSLGRPVSAVAMRIDVLSLSRPVRAVVRTRVDPMGAIMVVKTGNLR